MPDYVMVARNTSGDGFGDEPAKSKYLLVPDNAKQGAPAHAIKTKDWLDGVMAEAMPDEANPTPGQNGDILFFVHGFNNSPATVLERHRALKAGLVKLGYHGTVVS